MALTDQHWKIIDAICGKKLNHSIVLKTVSRNVSAREHLILLKFKGK
jgi:hypothetical protein